MELLLLAMTGAVAWVFLQEKKEKERLARLLDKYNSLTSKEEYESGLDKSIQEKHNRLDSLEISLHSLEVSVGQAKSRLDEYETEEYVQSFGLYKPIYNFENSVKYEEKLKLVRQQQKVMIKEKTAVVCHTEWQVEGSRRKGKKMTNDFLKLVLMAFNGKCDSMIPTVKYNNVASIEKRLINEFEKLNKLSESTHAEIPNNYLNLKLEELYLLHEFQEKKQEEKEEQKRIKEQVMHFSKGRRKR